MQIEKLDHLVLTVKSVETTGLFLYITRRLAGIAHSE